MRVLVACEKSGIIRDAFRALGHDAWSCDLAPSETASPFHLQEDCLLVLAREQFDLLIAHPPCRYLSSSGMHWTTRGLRDPQHTMDAIAFAEALWNAPVPRICIENPTGALSTRSCLGKATQSIQPHEFGHDASKKTLLWLKNLPPLQKTGPFIAPRMVNGKPRWANQTDSGQNRLGPSEKRSADRARTYVGIAKAMAEQWSEVTPSPSPARIRAEW